MRVCPSCAKRTEAAICPDDGLITLDEALLNVGDPMLSRVVGGKYAIDSSMGGGGMGAVYKARHTATGGFVALKVMRAGVAESQDAIKRFHLEAQNAAVLHSMHTVRVLDFGVDDGLLYLVMEYLDGEALNDVITRLGTLPWRRAAAIARQVLESLWEAHSHERRIVHRDIKPPNIFLVRKVDGADFVKVIDFGIARALDATGANTRGAIGTPHAMAPEQWRGTGVDGRTDLYAVGCVLYEMLSGRPPFLSAEGATPNERMMQLATAHISSVAEPIDERVPNIPPAFANLIHALLAKSPDDRPSSARDAIVSIDRCLAAPSGASAAWGDTAAEGVEIDTADLPTMAPGTEPTGSIEVRHTPQPEPSPDPPPGVDTAAESELAPTVQEPSESAEKPPKKRNWIAIIGLLFAWGVMVNVASRDAFNIHYNADEEPGSKVTVRGVKDPDKRAEVEAAVEEAAEAVAIAIEKLSGDDDKTTAEPAKGPSSTALTDHSQPPGAPGQATETTGPDVDYTAILSAQDHVNANGRPLRRAHHIVAQDRANYHRYQRRDANDDADPRFADKAARQVLRRLLRTAIAADDAERIVHGTPSVRVRVWGEARATVEIVEIGEH